MTRFDPRTLVRFDRFLDAVVSGAPPRSHGLDPRLVDAVLRVHSRNRVVSAGAPASPSLETARRSAARERTRPNRRPLALINAVATAALLLLVVSLGGYVVTSIQATPTAAPSGTTTGVYLVDAAGRFTPIDSLTLEDRPDLPTIALGAAATPTPGGEADAVRWLASRDGSTVVRLDVELNGTTWQARLGSAYVTIYDWPSGRVRSAFPAPDWKRVEPFISPDGRRLLFEGGGSLVHGQDGKLVLDQQPRWSVVDTETGQTTLSFEANDPALASMIRVGYVDPSFSHLYRLVPGGPVDTVGPWPVDLLAVDLATGREAGRLPLAEIEGGFWWTGERQQGPTTFRDAFLTPVMTFSPNGDRLYVLDGEAESVLIVNPVRLVIERRFALDLHVHISFSVPDAATNDDFWIYATHLTIGSDVRAITDASGRYLVVSGVRRRRIGTSVLVRDLQTQSIDLATGEWVSGGFAMTNPSPTGSWWWSTDPGLYAIGYPSNLLFEQKERAPWMLVRLDPKAAESFGQRILRDDRQVLVVPNDPARSR